MRVTFETAVLEVSLRLVAATEKVNFVPDFVPGGICALATTLFASERLTAGPPICVHFQSIDDAGRVFVVTVRFASCPGRTLLSFPALATSTHSAEIGTG